MTGEPVKLLLVDDIDDNLIALEALLRQPDLTIHTARSGNEALELLLVNDFALAILDVQMPDMDGFALAGADARNGAHPAHSDHLRHGRPAWPAADLRWLRSRCGRLPHQTARAGVLRR